MTDPRGRGGAGGLTPPVATAFAVVGFFALLIAGFGMLSLFTGAEVLPVSGLGQLPGIVGARSPSAPSPCRPGSPSAPSARDTAARRS
jgi:hypothetical protein